MDERIFSEIETVLRNWQQSDIQTWNNTSWVHMILVAAGWGPFGEAPGTPGGLLPTSFDRRNAALLLEKAIAAIREISFNSAKALLAADPTAPPLPILERRTSAQVTEIRNSNERFLSELERALSSGDFEYDPVEIAKTLGISESISPEGLDKQYQIESASLWIAAGKVIKAWKRNSEKPLSDDELQAIMPDQDHREPFQKPSPEFVETDAKAFEDFKQLVFETKGLSEHGLKCGMVGCSNPPTVPCQLGCSNHYCEECSKDHVHVHEAGKKSQSRLPRELN